MSRPRTNPALRAELARMIDEMTGQEYEPCSVTKRRLEVGERRTSTMQGNTEYTYNHAIPNAPVWHEIVQSFAPIPAWQIRRFIRAGLDGGRVSIWYRRAIDVARARLRKRAADTAAYGTDQDILRARWIQQQTQTIQDPILVTICHLAARNAAVRAMYQEQGVSCPDDYSE